MKKLFSYLLVLLLFPGLFSACEKDMLKTVVTPPSGIDGFSATANELVLSGETDAITVVTFKFQTPDYGADVVPTYTLQFDVSADTVGENAWENAINVKLADDSTQKSFSGADLNSLLVNRLELPVDEASTIVVRLKSEINQSTGVSSSVKPVYSVLTMKVTPYRAVVVYPALLVKGGNSWQTPSERTDGFILASAKFNNKYEGYLDLPNADGYGGDAFQLISGADGKVYGWGTDAYTLSEGGGNLWLTPAPAYMKVNVDLDAMTIQYTPVQFFISGDDNEWSTSATPMTYDAETKKWVAENVSLTAGNTFVFTCNDSYDISYKVDAKGTLVFAGSPDWNPDAVNIPVTKTGVFTVTLDLSGGDGNYRYSVK